MSRSRRLKVQIGGSGAAVSPHPVTFRKPGWPFPDSSLWLLRSGLSRLRGPMALQPELLHRIGVMTWTRLSWYCLPGHSALIVARRGLLARRPRWPPAPGPRSDVSSDPPSGRRAGPSSWPLSRPSRPSTARSGGTATPPGTGTARPRLTLPASPGAGNWRDVRMTGSVTGSCSSAAGTTSPAERPRAIQPTAATPATMCGDDRDQWRLRRVPLQNSSCRLTGDVELVTLAMTS